MSNRRRTPADLSILLLFALAVFAWFTWRALFMFFSGDDMMNMYKAWQTPPRELIISLAAFWKPAYRPMGGVVYRVAYGLFGFHPWPLYFLSWALLFANTILLYRLVAHVAQTSFHPLVACVVASVHGMYLELYYSAGTVYDHLSVFFCLTAVNIWFATEWRTRAGTIGSSCAIALLTIAACDSKENAVALPVVLLAAELLLIRRADNLRSRVRALIPIAVAAAVVLIFIAGRVAGTTDLASNPAYRPQLNASTLIANLTGYLRDFTYDATATPTALGIAFGGIAALTLALRSRVMIFGLVWFIAALLPIAFISLRGGYVLYMPMIGFAIWASDAAFRVLVFLRIRQRLLPVCAVLAVAFVCIWHSAEWPPDWVPERSPEWITTRQFLQRYPRMPRGAKLLFITDPFPREAYDLLFNLRLLYHDAALIADRLYSGMPDQRPHSFSRENSPGPYDHIFIFRQSGVEPGYYLELAPQWPIADFSSTPDR